MPAMSPSPEPPDFPASQLFLRRLAHHLVRDEARAEDLVQETWAAWVEHRPSGVAEPRAWLARVLRNRAFHLKRSEARRTRHEELAGRPDASAPETDGTLEAQAQLLEALRRLEEPYRSTLVQRYYHALSPTEIAERSGTPLNTVKARLARGLERLRGAMDRRYGGDRRAWCHWLTVLGAPGVPLPGGPSAAAVPPAAAGVLPGGAALLAWAGVALVLVAGAVLKALGSDAPRGPGSTPPSVSGGSEPGPLGVAPAGRGAAESAPSPAREARAEASPPPARSGAESARTADVSEPSTSARLAPASVRPFDWPQYAGGPAHDLGPGREDEIRVPRVLWFQPALFGAPGQLGRDLYAGGIVLARLDPASGAVRSVASPIAPGFASALAGLLSGDPSSLALTDLDPGLRKELGEILRRLSDPSDPDAHSIAPAPVVTPEAVIVRDLDDGSVRAFERDLSAQLWRHEVARESRPEHARVPLCLADERTLLVVAGSRLVALSVTDGVELWDFRCNGRIRMAPASDGTRVFFGTDKGLFLALSLSTGERLWQVSAGAFGTTPPVVNGTAVLASDQGSLPQQPGRGKREDLDPTASVRLHCFDANDGFERWSLGLGGGRLAPPGLFAGGGRALIAFGRVLVGVDLLGGGFAPEGRRSTGEPVCSAPLALGESVVLARADGLEALALRGLERRWFLAMPKGTEVQDLVHTGERAYLATTRGLLCVADDPGASAKGELVLQWSGEDMELERGRLGYGGER